MLKVFKVNSPFSILFILAALGLIFFVGLPLLLVAIAGLVLSSAVKRLFLGSSKTATPLSREDDSYVSPIIHNDKIGSYRVIENPNDPDVIEVEKL